MLLKKLGSKNVFEISLFCSPRLHLFDTKYNKNSSIVKYYYNLKELFAFSIYSILKCNIPVMVKLDVCGSVFPKVEESCKFVHVESTPLS